MASGSLGAIQKGIDRLWGANREELAAMAGRNKIKSGVAMVRVSGGLIRGLREGQNLTQLYLATAVGVTTETISRWERQDAPTLREENALKLAEVLAVPLLEILAQGPRQGPSGRVPHGFTQRWIILLGGAVLGLLVILLISTIFKREGPMAELQVTRFMPGHSVSGRPFPVLIKVDFVSQKRSSLLVKEQVPLGCRVIQTVPLANVSAAGLLKWVERDGAAVTRFAYMASCEPSTTGTGLFEFSGSLLVRRYSHKDKMVTGESQLRLVGFHWADTDKDNVIDDEELLAAYDDFGRVPGLLIDLDEVESIWMGSGYRWEPSSQTFVIIP